jgi:hypothetical protein
MICNFKGITDEEKGFYRATSSTAGTNNWIATPITHIVETGFATIRSV